jgi:hypothetical protein
MFSLKDSSEDSVNSLGIKERLMYRIEVGCIAGRRYNRNEWSFDKLVGYSFPLDFLKPWVLLDFFCTIKSKPV